jgi:hypothetical protein
VTVFAVRLIRLKQTKARHRRQRGGRAYRSVERCWEAAIGLAETAANAVLADLATVAPAPKVSEQAQAAFACFTLHVILEMLPLGVALEAALPP